MRTSGPRSGVARRSSRGEIVLQVKLGHGPISARALGLIERPVGALDKVSNRFAGLKLGDANRDRNGSKLLTGRALAHLALGNGCSNALGNVSGRFQLRALQHADQFLSAVTSGKVGLAKQVPEHAC